MSNEKPTISVTLGEHDFAVIVTKRPQEAPVTRIYAKGRQLGFVQSVSIDQHVNEVIPRVRVSFANVSANNEMVHAILERARRDLLDLGFDVE
jgi:hypothetical protein